MPKERDSQRSKLYAAEREALVPIQELFPNIKAVERYVRKNAKRKFLTDRYGAAVTYPITVHNGGGRRAAGGMAGWISIPLWARNDWVVLHEWAHSIHQRLGGSGSWFYEGKLIRCTGKRVPELCGGAAHGWQFAAIFLDLVHACMGADAAKALKASFRAHRVRFRKPVKRKAGGNIEALAAWRAKKQAA